MAQPQRKHVGKAIHDRCLRVAIDRTADLTEAQKLTLNIVAVAWACDDTVTDQEFNAAMTILARFEP